MPRGFHDAHAARSNARWNHSSGAKCGFCGLATNPWGRCTRRWCAAYIGTWVGDAERVIRTNLAAYTDGSREVVLASISPPGASQLPWDTHVCRERGPHRCSGAMGCRTDAVVAAEYNRSAARRMGELHRQVSKRVKRATQLTAWVLLRVFELQLRGVVHCHLVLAFGTPEQRVATRSYIHHLAECSKHKMFGFVGGGVVGMPAIRAAKYVSKSLKETVRDFSTPARTVTISTHLTRATGCTFRSRRMARFHHATGGSA